MGWTYASPPDSPDALNLSSFYLARGSRRRRDSPANPRKHVMHTEATEALRHKS